MRLNARSKAGISTVPAGTIRLKPTWMTFLFFPILLGSSFFGLRWAEYALTFHPQPYSPNRAWELPRGGEDVSFLNHEGVRLHGWFVNSRSQPASATVIYFHGNAGNITNVGFIGEGLAALGFDVLLFDYRGYGKSEGSIAGERDLYADADAAYEYIVDQREVHPQRVVLYGHSLGSAAAVDVASRNPCGAIVLESGFSSASEMASSMLPWIPGWLHSLAKNRFDSARKLAAVQRPVLVVHGEPDNVVPTDQGRRLFSAANEPKKLIILAGAGHGVAGFGGHKYFAEMANFIHTSLEDSP